jgi:signal transduction histidine kinase
MSTQDERIHSLQSTVLCHGLSYDDVSQVLKKFQEVRLSKDTMLFDAHTSGDRVYIIEEGVIRISRVTAFGEEITLDILGRGEIVGELALLDGQTRSARATCIEDSILLSLDKPAFEELLRSSDKVAFNLLRELSGRIRKTDDHIVQRLFIEDKFTKLQRLIEASKIINSTLDLNKLLGLILDLAVQSIEADRGTLYLVDDSKKELWSKVLQGTDMIEIRLPLGKGLSGFVAERGETIIVPDAYADPRFNSDIDKLTGYRTHNMLCMPMKNKDGKIIGVFQLLNKKQGCFDNNDVSFIDALSAHASVAIENARMTQELIANDHYLKKEHERQRELSHLLIDLQEKERKRIAAELHDSIGQDILIIKNYALLGLRSKKSLSKMAEQLQEISTYASQTLEDIRKISQNLRPVLLDRLGLTEALKNLISTIATVTSIHATASIDAIDNIFDKESEINLFRLVQESLNNVIKHSQATEAEVRIIKNKKMIHVVITDNGKGIATTTSEKKIFDGLGQVVMLERVSMLKGTWECTSTPETGTTIMVEIPW